MHSRFSIGLIGSFSAGFQRQSSWVHVANIGTGLRSRFRGNLAEWSKALALGASPRGRGFEPHSYHTRRMAAALSATVLFWHFWLFFSCFFLYVLLPPRCLAGLRHPARARASGKPAPVASISTASHHHYVLASLACCVGALAEPTANRRSSTFVASCMSISNPPSVQSGGVAAWHGISERVQSDGARAARPRLARLSARLRLWASVLQPARSPGSRCHGLRRRFLRLSAARLAPRRTEAASGWCTSRRRGPPR